VSEKGPGSIRNVYSPEQEVRTITLEVEVPPGVDTQEWRAECLKAMEDGFALQKYTADVEAGRRRREKRKSEILASDAGLESCIREMFRGRVRVAAIGRAVWYQRRCTSAQEVDFADFAYDVAPFDRKEGRRPVFMRGSIRVICKRYSSIGWRAMVIRRYLRCARYTCKCERDIERHVVALDRRLLNNEGYGHHLQRGRMFGVPDEARRDLRYLMGDGGFAWVEGQRLPFSDEERQLAELASGRVGAIDMRGQRSAVASDRALDLSMQLGKLEKHIHDSQNERADSPAD
jgi:hypothetical protein